REQHGERALVVGEQLDVVERLQRREDAEHRGHAQDAQRADAPGVPIHRGTIDGLMRHVKAVVVAPVDACSPAVTDRGHLATCARSFVTWRHRFVTGLNLNVNHAGTSALRCAACPSSASTPTPTCGWRTTRAFPTLDW